MDRAKQMLVKNENLVKTAEVPKDMMSLFRSAKKDSTYSFGTEAKNNLKRYLFAQSPQLPGRQYSRETEDSGQKFMKHFKNLSTSNAEEPPKQYEGYYRQLTRESQESAITKIMASTQKSSVLKYESRFGFDQTILGDPIVDPGVYTYKYSNNMEKETAAEIFGEIGKITRLCLMKERGKDFGDQTLLDLKDLTYETYAEAILQRSNNLLFSSIMKSFGMMSIDEEIRLPEPFEIKERKQLKSIEINTDPSPTYHKESGAPIILETRNSELIMLEIEREKARKEKPTDYISVVEAKLVELLNYILQGDASYNGLELQDKIRKVLREIEYFKGKYLDGQPKINLLLYFFRETKALKDMKENMQRLESINRVRHNYVTPARHMDEPQQDNKSTVSHKAVSQIVPPTKNNQDDGWIGVARNN